MLVFSAADFEDFRQQRCSGHAEAAAELLAEAVGRVYPILLASAAGMADGSRGMSTGACTEER